MLGAWSGSSAGGGGQLNHYAMGNADHAASHRPAIMTRRKNKPSTKTDWNDVIIINVGGVRHETLRATLSSHPGTRLADLVRLRRHYRPDRNDYFFDRSPALFEYILNFYRVGELHLPPGSCSEMVQREFEYWGIDKHQLRGCCWLKFNAQCMAYKTLQEFAQGHAQNYDLRDLQSKSCFRRWRGRIWAFLDDPYSSLPAKALGIVSIMFVLLSIFTFAAETHPYFHGNYTGEDLSGCQGPMRPEEILATCSRLGLLTCQQAASHSSYTPSSSVLMNSTLTYNTTGPTDNGGGGQEDYYDVLYDTQIETFLLGWMGYPSVVLGVMDLMCYSFFTLEVALRLVFCPAFKKFFHSGFNIVDVLSIVLFYIEIMINAFQRQVASQRPLLDALFILRILRIFRVFRLVRHHRGLQVLVYTLRASVKEIFLLVVFLAIGVLLFGSLIYYADNANDAFRSIPHGLWWAIVTMTTVGYGDIVPCSTWGKMVGATCAICGLLMIAFTAPVIVNNFMLFYHQVQFGKKPDQPKSTTSARPSIVWPFANFPPSQQAEVEENAGEDSKLGSPRETDGGSEVDVCMASGVCASLPESTEPSPSRRWHDDALKDDGEQEEPIGVEEEAVALAVTPPNLIRPDTSPPPETPPPNYYSMTFQTYI